MLRLTRCPRAIQYKQPITNHPRRELHRAASRAVHSGDDHEDAAQEFLHPPTISPPLCSAGISRVRATRDDGRRAATPTSRLLKYLSVVGMPTARKRKTKLDGSISPATPSTNTAITATSGVANRGWIDQSAGKHAVASHREQKARERDVDRVDGRADRRRGRDDDQRRVPASEEFRSGIE